MAHYISTKTFDHTDQLYCSYRIWNSKSDSRFIHGHLLQIKLVFSCSDLTEHGRIVELNGFEEVSDWILDTFSYTLCVSTDDPYVAVFSHLGNSQLAKIRVLEGVGCEHFARLIWHKVDVWLGEKNHKPRVLIRTVEIVESQGHSIYYIG